MHKLLSIESLLSDIELGYIFGGRGFLLVYRVKSNGVWQDWKRVREVMDVKPETLG